MAGASPAMTERTKDRIGRAGTLDGVMATQTYDAGARLLHWAVAVLLVTTVPIGITMYNISEGHLQDVLYVVHESIGLTILALMLARLCWRIGRGAPAPSSALGP